MEDYWKTILLQQYGAVIEMLETSITVCPEQIWSDRAQKPEYWYLVYHTLLFLDLYLSGSLDGFAPPAPFTLDELDPAGVLPERVYAKEELRNFLLHCRKKCRTTIGNLTDAKAQKICKFSRFEISYGELLLDNLQHVQHHVAQLNLILRQIALFDTKRHSFWNITETLRIRQIALFDTKPEVLLSSAPDR